MAAPRRKADAWGRIVLTDAENAADLLYAGGDLGSVGFESSDPVVMEFNRWAEYFNKDGERIGALSSPALSPAEEHALRVADWTIPEPWASVDLGELLLPRCTSDIERARLREELDLFGQKNLTALLRVALMLVEHFRKNGIVWGVGRGSSVASFALYCIGLNRLNPLHYDLDITEFLR